MAASELNIKEILESVKAMYESDPRDKKLSLAKGYSTSPTFKDPIMTVSGRDQMYVEFRALMALFKEVKVEFDEGSVDVVKSGNGYVMSVLNTQRYVFRITNLPVVVKAKTQLRLVNEGGKLVIAEHEDTWLTGDLFKWIPFYQSYGRPITGRVSSLALKALYRNE
jgi:hypothetical protein